MKKRIKRIILTTVIVLIAVSALLTIPSTAVDIKVLGDNYKYHLYDKYVDELDRYVMLYDKVYDDDDSLYVYYYDIEDFTFSIPARNIDKAKLIEYDGRKLYITLDCKYKDKKIDIKFEGTKIIADVYSWKMVKNELFPLPDSNLELAYEMEYV